MQSAQAFLGLQFIHELRDIPVGTHHTFACVAQLQPVEAGKFDTPWLATQPAAATPAGDIPAASVLLDMSLLEADAGPQWSSSAWWMLQGSMVDTSPGMPAIFQLRIARPELCPITWAQWACQLLAVRTACQAPGLCIDWPVSMG